MIKFELGKRFLTAGKTIYQGLLWRFASGLPFADGVKHEGRVEIWALDENGEEEKIVDTTNLVVDVGLNALRENMRSDEQSVYIQRMAFGTGGTAESSSDTSLGTKVHEEHFDGNTATGTGEVRFNTVIDSVEPSGQPYDIEEFGVLLSDGTLWSRITFPAETKDSTQEWRVRYTSTWQNA